MSYIAKEPQTAVSDELAHRISLVSLQVFLLDTKSNHLIPSICLKYLESFFSFVVRVNVLYHILRWRGQDSCSLGFVTGEPFMMPESAEVGMG